MDLRDAQNLARSLMREHGVSDWGFHWTNAVRVFGVCSYRKHSIGLSRPLTYRASEAEVRETLLHEIAHAIAGGAAGHGPAWRSVARRIGSNGSRCYEATETLKIAAPWLLQCPGCGYSVERHRRVDTKGKACGKCCRKNGGKYDPRFMFRYVRNPAA